MQQIEFLQVLRCQWAAVPKTT